MPDELRQALEAAYEQDQGEKPEIRPADTVDDGEEDEREQQGQQEQHEARADTGEAGEPTAESGDDTEAEEADDTTEEEKASLKFLPAEEEEGAGEEEGGSPAAERPPVGWRAHAKEHWGQLPEAVRNEVLRRERETATALDQSTTARRFVDEFQRTIAPYQEFIEAERSTPLQAVQNLMQTAAALRTGSPEQKAVLLSNVIKQFKVDVPMLDALLVGEASSGANGQDLGQVSELVDQKLAPVNQFLGLMQQAQQRSEEQSRSEIKAEMDDFAADPAHPYFEDVRNTMGDLMAMYADRKEKLSLQEAYDRAVAMDPEISALAQKRKAATEAKQQRMSLQRKKRAAASVQSNSQGTGALKQPNDLRGALEASWDLYDSGAR